MQFGVNLSLVRAPRRAEVARHAEALGFDSAWLPDHLLLPSTFEPRYPYARDGHPPIIHRAPISDAFIGLTHIAAATSRIKLGTGVYILPLRNPFVTAKAVATLDLLSEGRVLFGVGIGWMREEFEAAGVQWAGRAARTEEYIDVMRTLWTADEPVYRGPTVTFAPLSFDPKPAQQPVPILVGGESGPALDRAARIGDGWYGARNTPERVREQIARLHDLRTQHGRDHLPFQIVVSAPSPTPEEATAFADAGVDTLVVTPFTGYRTAIEGLERFAASAFAR